MAFWKSFKREIGKNSGKWASNKIFGEKWSTPYRFNKTLSSIENEKRVNLKNNNINSQTSSVKTNDKFNLFELYDDILSLDIKTDLANLRDTLEFLSGVVYSLSGVTNKEPIENKILNLALEKMDIALFYLKDISPRDYDYFKKKIRVIKLRKLIKIFLIILLIFFSFLYTVLVYGN